MITSSYNIYYCHNIINAHSAYVSWIRKERKLLCTLQARKLKPISFHFHCVMKSLFLSIYARRENVICTIITMVSQVVYKICISRGRKVNCFLLITSTMHSLCTVSRYKSVPMATVKCGFTKCPLRLLSDRNFPPNHFTKLKAINQMRVSCSGTHRDERLFVQSERTRRKYIRSWLIESLSL